VGSPHVPATPLKEALAYAKSRQGQLNFGAPLGSYAHLDMLALTARAGVKMLHVPTRGAGETLPNLLRGDTHIQISNVASTIGPVRAGQIKAFAVTADKRLPEVPQIPTMAEAGFPGIGSLNWNGLFAPVRTPRGVVDRLYRDTVAAMKELDAEGVLAKRQLPVALSAAPAALDEFVSAEAARWQKIISENQVKIN
jgi:tripartite-type tricarboxylate transporter receptor subunit TctC